LSSLIDSTARSPPPSLRPKLLAVARESDLPGTVVEIEDIQKAVKGHLQATLLHGKDATVEKVTSELKTANWVHFACHGVQNLAHPLESALLLAGAERLTLAKIASLRIGRGDLAFLSACQTATGDEKLSDEAVHLSAGMLVTGYRGVIATMWSVADRVAPQVARDVYDHLMVSKGDPTEAAHALHLAVQNLRRSNESEDDGSLMSWVPFIHLGR
jgi:CHAT domain-containing protein